MVNEFACSYLPKSSKYFEEICLTDETFLERVGSLNIVIGVLALLLVAAIVLFLLFKFKKVLCCRQHKDNKVSSPGKFLCHFYLLLYNNMLFFNRGH